MRDLTLHVGARQDPLAPIGAGRSACVTGGSGGIGLAVAARLADLGFGLSLVGRRDDALKTAITSLKVKATATPVDITSPEGPRYAIEAHVAEHGNLDLLVVAAGTSRRESIADADLEKSRRVIDTNLNAVVGLLAAAMPALRSSGARHGKAVIVLIGSLAGVHPVANYAVYSASKAGVISLARSVNEEEWRHGIRATAICPGYVDTEMTQPVRDKLAGTALLPPSDIAETVSFLLRLSPTARIDQIDLGRAGTTGAVP